MRDALGGLETVSHGVQLTTLLHCLVHALLEAGGLVG